MLFRLHDGTLGQYSTFRTFSLLRTPSFRKFLAECLRKLRNYALFFLCTRLCTAKLKSANNECLKKCRRVDLIIELVEVLLNSFQGGSGSKMRGKLLVRDEGR